MVEVESLIECGVEIIALDATKRVRPGGISLNEFFQSIRHKYPNQLFMADCSSTEEGITAANIGFDLIGTTMAGYTDYTKGRSIPPYDMIQELVKTCGKPVVAEGNISTPAQLRQAMDLGIPAAIVGSAITRPLDITKKFIEVL